MSASGLPSRARDRGGDQPHVEPVAGADVERLAVDTRALDSIATASQWSSTGSSRTFLPVP
jgi:hypothetical protein